MQPTRSLISFSILLQDFNLFCMKKVYLFLFAVIFSMGAFAQMKPYNEDLNGMEQIHEAIENARETGKYVLVQVGYNACPWCVRFAEYAESNEVVHKIIEENFVYIHVNWSKANKNEEAMEFMGNPARFGFPVFVVINQEGRPIHIQNSAYLEEGKGYDEKKVSDFLLNWTEKAVKTLK